MTNSGKGLPSSPKEFKARIDAVRRGCGICKGLVTRSKSGIPAGDPFSVGPHQGCYWCDDCWTLWYDDHPAHLADIESRQYVSKEAIRIRSTRRGE